MNEWITAEFAPGAAERVRAGVRTKIRRRRAAIRSTAAAALAALALVLWPSPPPTERLALTMPTPPSAPIWTPPPKPPIFTVRAQSRPAERIIIYTDDPNVVIILVADGGADE